MKSKENRLFGPSKDLVCHEFLKMSLPMASISVMSLKLSRAFTRWRKSCFMSVSVIVFAMQPNTTRPRGCNAGLYRKAKLLAKAVHWTSQLACGTLGAQSSKISNKASVISANESNDKGSLRKEKNSLI